MICGTVDGTRGPVQDIVAEPEYLDITDPLIQVSTTALRAGTQ